MDSAVILARRIADLDLKVDSLSRASQLSRSTVAVDGVDLPVPDAIGQGVHAGIEVDNVRTDLEQARVDLEAAQQALEQNLEAAELLIADAEARLDTAAAQITDAFGRIGTVEVVADEAASTATSAQAAADAAWAAAGVAVVGSVAQFAVNSSETVPPTGGWSTATPTRTPGTFIWMRTQLTFGDTSTSTTSPVLVTGNAGAPGEDGKGIEIAGSVAAYGDLPSGLGPGDAGKGYLVEADGLLYIWSGTVFPADGHGVAFKGDPGDPGVPGDSGSDGVAVASLTVYYRTLAKSSPAPAAPTVSPPGAPWVTTEPGYVPNVNLWSVVRVVYSNSTFAYSSVSKVSAYTAASEAQETADAAHDLAGDAETHAQAAIASASAAQSTVNGLPKILHGTTVATGTAPNGSIWWQHDGSLSGNVIGQWNRVSGSWVATPIDSRAIANLDVGKLTAGSADIAELVAQKIAVASGQFLELDVSQLVASSATIDTAVIQKLFTDVVVARMVLADQFIGSNAIINGSVTANKVAANAIDGKTITGALVRSSASGARTELTSQGLRVLNSSNQELVKLGYGITTGMEVRNPSTGQLVPLANAAFGLEAAYSTVHLAFNTSYSGQGGTWSDWRRHSGSQDQCVLSFTAVASRYVVDFSQTFTVSYSSSGFPELIVCVGLEVNGEMLTSAGFDVVSPIFSLYASNSASMSRYRVARTSAVVSTTPGQSYEIRMHFKTQSSGGGTGTIEAAVRNRYITATPVFR